MEEFSTVLRFSLIKVTKKGVQRYLQRKREGRWRGVQSERGDVMYRASYSREKKSNC